MIQHQHFFLLLLLLLLSSRLSSQLQCFAGSRGYVKQELSESFIKMQCDDGMQYCIESYNSNYEEVTASCQTLATSRRVLNICESGKTELANDVSTRCCSESLCNSKGVARGKTNQTVIPNDIPAAW